MFSKFSSFSPKEYDVEAFTGNFKNNMDIMLPPTLDVRNPFKNLFISSKLQ